jgi:gliding motility-associated-like protein
MMPLLRFYTIALLVHCFTLAGRAQLLSLPVNSAFSGTTYCDMDGWQEDISARTATTAFWKHADGRVRMESASRPIHYSDESGHWKRIIATPARTGEMWIAANQPNPVALTDDGQAIIGFNTPDELRIGKEVLVQGQPMSFRPLSTGADAREIVSASHAEIRKNWHFGENSIKYSYMLDSPPAGEHGAHWTLSESIHTPSNALLSGDDHFGKEAEGLWMGDLVVTRNEVTSARIRGAICFDSAGHIHLARYSWEQSEQGWIIHTHIDMEWLSHPETVYPVTIDPLVIGPTSNWGPEPMPSCLIPEFNADSILVEVPGEITVTALFVTASFYADPFTFAVMEDGAMFFSTECGETDYFEVQPPNGNIAGTAYLENFDLRSDLMCCYTPSCSATNFWLTMHLGRYTPSGDCNSTYVYYDPSTLWPFSAVVEGRTVETTGLEWTVSGTPQCSDDCEFNGTIRARYGVRPYTFTHPWSEETVVTGGPAPCQLNSESESISLTWPGCPEYCPNFDQIEVAAALITDACGNTVINIPPDILNIKPTPEPVLPPPPVVVCPGETVTISACIPDAVIYWAGNGASGSGGIVIPQNNNSSTIVNTNYDIYAEFEGCESPVTNFEIGVLPVPDVEFTTIPEPAVVGIPIELTDQSNPGAGSVIGWTWTMDGQLLGAESSIPALFEEVGTYTICLGITTSNQCVAEECGPIEVIPAEVVAPNIFTPNNDGKNDALEFLYLEFLPDNHLTVRNRWGGLVYEKSGYRNNWSGDDLAEGVYYYVLLINGREPKEGYVHLVR